MNETLLPNEPTTTSQTMTDQIVTTNWSFKDVKNYMYLLKSRLDQVMKENKQLHDKVQS
jgi:hypothetical protein